jgi:hypothetical protein
LQYYFWLPTIRELASLITTSAFNVI